LYFPAWSCFPCITDESLQQDTERITLARHV
jgi:hypothetical protein